MLKASPKMFCDETRCPVLDPGRGQTKTGFMGRSPATTGRGAAPTRRQCPKTYAPGRGGEHAAKLLDGFSGVVDGSGIDMSHSNITRITVDT
jgi:transposase